MRKYFATALTFFALALNLVPATAVEVTDGDSSIYFRDSASNGFVHVVAWSKRVGEDGSKVMVSIKRGSGSWSTKKAIGELDWSTWANPQAGVRADGSVILAWVDDNEIVYRQLPANSSVWEAETVLANSQITGSWIRELDVLVDGNAATVIGVRSGTGQDSVLASWTQEDSTQDFIYAEITSAFNSSVFGSCTKAGFNECGYGFNHFQGSTNQNGVQTIAWSLTRIKNNNYDLKGAIFAIFTARRNGINSSWSNPTKLDVMKPTVSVNNYAFFIESLVTTPNGTAAIAWRRGFNSAKVQAFAAKTTTTGSTFAKIDSAAISGKGEANAIKLGFLQNTIYLAVEAVGGSSFNLFTGKLGSFAAAKKWAGSGKYRMVDSNSTNSSSSLVFIGDTSSTQGTVFQAKLTAAGALGGPTSVKKLPSSIGKVDQVLTVKAGDQSLFVISGYSGRVFGKGLDAVLL